MLYPAHLGLVDETAIWNGNNELSLVDVMSPVPTKSSAWVRGGGSISGSSGTFRESPGISMLKGTRASPPV